MRFFLPALLFSVLNISILYAGDKPKVDHVAPAPSMGFKENKKQWNDKVLFATQLRGTEIYLERNSVSYVLFNREEQTKVHPKTHAVTVHGHAYRMSFEGALPDAQIIKSGESKDFCNYFKGNNPDRWASHVHSYTTVYYKNIYPGIDVRFYFNNGVVKYDFIVHPGADPSLIKLKYIGTNGLYLKQGSLHIKTSVGDAVEALPLSYQTNYESSTVNVKSKYKIKDSTVSFAFPSGYDNTRELIIDPTLIFSTYTGSTADNWGFTSTFDNQGNMYLGGFSNDLRGGNFPVTPGAFQQTFGGGEEFVGLPYASDITIAKINPTGTAFIYATYLGGISNESPHSLFVNSQGQLVMYGRTYSKDYPVTNNAYDRTENDAGINTDMVVTVLSRDGTSLIGSTYIGGEGDDGANFTVNEYTGGDLKVNYGDDARGEVVCDASDNIYIASCTASMNFPVTDSCFQSQYAGIQDGCVFKFSPDVSQLIYSTYLGGAGADACYSLSLKNSDRSVYVSGGTMSFDFPTTDLTVQPNFAGGSSDGFIAHLSVDGRSMLNSTYVGTIADDQSYFVKMDNDENVYITGQTSGNFPVSQGVYNNANSGQFIVKYKPDLDSIYFSTVFGNGNHSPNISPTAFLVDTCDNIYVAGWGGEIGDPWNFNTNNMQGMTTTTDALQRQTDGVDFYIIVLNRNARNLLYATYFGNANGALEHVDGGTSRFDANGVIYGAICASCINKLPSPTTQGVISETDSSNNCNELGFKIDLGQVKVKAASLADPAATGCTPLTVNFINKSINSTTWRWNFGTALNDSSRQMEPRFTYTEPGTYHVRLIASNPAACYPVDTAYTTVTVLNTFADASFNITTTDYCDSFKVSFKTITQGTGLHYKWDFGDGSTSTLTSPSHTYTYPGVYTAKLVFRDDSTCNPLDSVVKTVDYTSRIITRLSVDSLKGCKPYTVDLLNEGFGYNVRYHWDFGDGTTSDLMSGKHTYKVGGQYILKLVMSNNAACNRIDSAIVIVTVLDTKVVASAPLPMAEGCIPLVTTFKNNSIDAVQWQWNFGTGVVNDTSNKFEPDFTYKNRGDYEVRLIARNPSLCVNADTFFTTVKAKNTFADASFSVSPNDLCDSLKATFITPYKGPMMHYTWDFGDSTSSTAAQPTHTYYKAGYYSTSLILQNDTACHPLDTFLYVLPYTSKIDAEVTQRLITGCPPIEVNFTNVGYADGATSRWIFGDGSSSTDVSVKHVYSIPGEYTAMLILDKPAACNGTDTAFMTIKVLSHTINAAFSADPEIITQYGPVQFTNQSTGAANYIWRFGDGESSEEFNPSHFYRHIGKYRACLSAFNGEQCPDLLCRQISIEFDPNIGVPNAFSPNGDGENDILYVRGQGIVSLHFKVFNRWGQLVFETDNISEGWDGKFKGAPQDMDVYAWVLTAELDANKSITQSGNVTLIR